MKSSEKRSESSVETKSHAVNEYVHAWFYTNILDISDCQWRRYFTTVSSNFSSFWEITNDDLKFGAFKPTKWYQFMKKSTYFIVEHLREFIHHLNWCWGIKRIFSIVVVVTPFLSPENIHETNESYFLCFLVSCISESLFNFIFCFLLDARKSRNKYPKFWNINTFHERMKSPSIDRNKDVDRVAFHWIINRLWIG